MSKVVGRVALAVSSLGGGGAERVMVNLANELVAKGVHVDLIVKYKKGPNLDKLDKQVNICALYSPDEHIKVKKVFHALQTYKSYVRECKPDVLISTNRVFNMHLWALRFITGSKTPHICREADTLTGTYFSEETIKNKISRLFLRAAYRDASLIVANSSVTARDLKEKLSVPCQKIRIIYNPLNIEAYRTQSSKKVISGFNNSGARLVACGRLIKKKNFEYLIECFIKLLEERPDAELIIMGDGPKKQELQDKINVAGIGERCWLIGFVKSPEEYFCQADVFVQTSSYEGFGYVLVEAMACGLPVVAVDGHGAMREILSDGAYGELVREGNVKEMVRAIKKQIDTPTDPALLSQAVERFRSERIVNEYLEAFKTAIQ